MAILPHLILAAGGLVIFGVGAFGPRRPPGLLFALALLTALGAGLAAIPDYAGESAFSAMLDPGTYGRFFTLLIAAITGLTLLFVRQYSRVRGFAGDELYALLLFAALGMSLAAGAVHWLIFFLGLELLSICLYVLIAIRKNDAGSNEAGLKYFIMGAVASGILTFGLALIYAARGTLMIRASLAGGGDSGDFTLTLLGLALVLVGIGFKISLVPFHLWTPDVYQGAPAPVTAFLSTGSKVALFAALLRFSLDLRGPLWAYALPAIWVLAALTMTVGNITALAQTRVKRLLAYSSVAQMGYLFMTLVAVKESGPAAIIFYLAVYAVMDLGAFGLVGALSPPSSDRDSLEDFKGLGFTRPWLAGVLALCLISLAGLPPTAGFMGKLLLFKAVLEARFAILAVIGIFSAIISIYFYMKVLAALYMRQPEPEAAVGADFSVSLGSGIILALILALGLLPSTLLGAISRVTQGLTHFH